MSFPFSIGVPIASRFAGDFCLSQDVGSTVSPVAKAFHDRLLDMLSDLAEIATDSKAAAFHSLDDERRSLTQNMMDMAADARVDRLDCHQAVLQSHEMWGHFKAKCEQIDACLFQVFGLDQNADQIPVGKRTGYVDILCQYNTGTPTTEQIALMAAVDSALAVVRKVVAPRNTSQAEVRAAVKRRNASREEVRSDYVRTLTGVAKLGLERGQMALATSLLASFRQEFVLGEASAIKNRYVSWLGIWAVLLGGGAAYLYMRIHHGHVGYFHFVLPQLRRFENMILISIGAAAGAWLAFLIKRPTLTFDDLTQLDEDLLQPGWRMTYTMLLAPVVGLIFWTGMVTVTIGGFVSHVQTSGSVSVLVGVLCGVASRAVATAVGRRADDFAAAIGGTAKPSTSA